MGDELMRKVPEPTGVSFLRCTTPITDHASLITRVLQ